MGLQEYKRKRDFTKTPEPPPDRTKGKKGARKAKAPLSYLIQKHDATRLHYDFRLELDGVLLSWAVPKAQRCLSRRKANTGQMLTVVAGPSRPPPRLTRSSSMPAPMVRQSNVIW